MPAEQIPITRNNVVKLKHGDVIYHKHLKNADGTPQQWRVTGKVQIWKTRPNEFLLPIKRGLKVSGYLTEFNANQYYLEREP